MATVTIGGRTYEVEVRGDRVVVDGQEFPVTVRDDGAYRTVKAGDVQYRVQLPSPDARESRKKSTPQLGFEAERAVRCAEAMTGRI